MDENTIIKGKRKTNRVEFVRALHANCKNLPQSGTIDLWCDIMVSSYSLIGMKVYCHKSNQNSLPNYAKARNEWGRYELADYHCDVQHDISKLNRDTVDPSLANTDPMFPRNSHWIFFNDINANTKCINLSQLEKVAAYCQTIKVNKSGLFISSDGHICKSSPEYVVEEWLIKHGIPHLKEGDIDKATGKRATEYPFDVDLNPGRRSIEADWELWPGKFTYKIIVEYFEGKGYEGYAEKVERKRALAKKNGIILIEFLRPDLKEELFSSKFKDFIAD
jgi:hypothetical protein